MRYILKVEDAGTHSITDEDLDQLVDSLEGPVDPKIKGLTLREAIRLDVNDSLGWKKAGYHPALRKHKLIFKYQSDAIKDE